MEETKQCTKCKQIKPLTDFCINRAKKSGRNPRCKACQIEDVNAYRAANPDKVKAYSDRWYKENGPAPARERRHRLGLMRPMEKATDCSSYLGVHIAERVLSGIYDHIELMPYGNPGYDFICGKGFKIDCKSSCLIKKTHGSYGWDFMIRRNKVADYFLCLAFDNREDLTPMHIWLIPGNRVNHLITFGVYNGKRSLSRVNEYERPIENVLKQCDAIRTHCP